MTRKELAEQLGISLSDARTLEEWSERYGRTPLAQVRWILRSVFEHEPADELDRLAGPLSTRPLAAA